MQQQSAALLHHAMLQGSLQLLLLYSLDSILFNICFFICYPMAAAHSFITTQELTSSAYSDYGSVIGVNDIMHWITPKPANQGTAKRYNSVTQLINLRPNSAQANVCLFDCTPHTLINNSEFHCKLLERHEYSTQLFVPMNGASRYLVIVALGTDKPDLSTLKGFMATANQGITYKPGVWHHPLIALDKQTQFFCVVNEDNTKEDCEIVQLQQIIPFQIKS
jgi:ureidoglycolate lyase